MMEFVATAAAAAEVVETTCWIHGHQDQEFDPKPLQRLLLLRLHIIIIIKIIIGR